MAKYLNSTDDLKTYIFRKLGSEIHTVEVTDSQWDDIVDNSKTFFFDYSDWGTYSQSIIVDPNGQNEITLSDDILSVSMCHGLDDIANMANIAYPSSSLYYMLAINGGSDIQMSAFVVMKQYMNTFKDLFREQVLFDFNTETKKLRLGRTDYKKIAFQVMTAENVDEIVNNYFFKIIVEMNTLQQWGDNIGIKYNTSDATIMGNGLRLNPDKMWSKAQEIRDRIDKGIDEDEWGTLIPPKRLFG